MTPLVILMLAVILSVVQAAFFSALPAPISLLQLPLVLMTGLVTGFRFRLALLAALAGGMTLDILTPSGRGIPVLILLAVTAALILLFTRTFTHLTAPSFIAINAAGFAFYHFLVFVFGIVRNVLAGFPRMPDVSAERFVLLAVGFILQTALTALLLLAGKKMKKVFLSTFFVVH